MENKFFSNLDLVQGFLQQLRDVTERFDVGDAVRFTSFVPERELRNNTTGRPMSPRSFDLLVVAKTYDVTNRHWLIELHIPANVGTIADWEKWFRRHVLGEELPLFVPRNAWDEVYQESATRPNYDSRVK